MIDLHCHVLPGDDGAKDFDEGIELIKRAYTLGYRTLVCSSHFKEPDYINEKYEENFRILKERLKEEGVLMELIKGNELFLTSKNISFLDKKKVNTINGTNYLLVEAIPGMTFQVVRKILTKMIGDGYRPILAHVERYHFSDIETLRELKGMGVVIQVNIRSLRRNKKIYRWIENNLVDVLGSDSHNLRHRNYDLKEILEGIKERIGGEKFGRLTLGNPKRIVEGKDVEEVERGGEVEKTNSITSIIRDICNKLFRGTNLR